MINEDYDVVCEGIQEEIMELTDKYSNYISSITINWKEEKEK